MGEYHRCQLTTLHQSSPAGKSVRPQSCDVDCRFVTKKDTDDAPATGVALESGVRIRGLPSKRSFSDLLCLASTKPPSAIDLQYEAPSTSKKTLLKRAVGTDLAVCGTAAVTLGLYGYHAETFHHDTARLLTEIASAKGIQVTFRPSARSSSMPTGISIESFLFPKTTATGALSFDGRITYEHVGLQYNFTLLNDKGFVTVQNVTSGQLTRTECLVKDNIPPFSMLTDALTHARVIDALIEVVFADEPYVFCSSASSEIAVAGEDLSASIKLLQDNSEGAPSTATLTVPAGLNIATCGALSTSAPAKGSLTERAVQRAQYAWTVATGERRLASMGSSDCSCKDGLKKCLFVHGLGYSAGETTTSFPEYFGTIEQQASCCSEVKFLHVDTLNSPWYADASTDAICNEAIKMTGATDKMAIENIALVAHSMGNLVVNAAFLHKKCGLAPTAKYIALNGPMYGSASASSGLTILKALPQALVARFCVNDPSTTVDDPIVKALTFFGLCPTAISLSSIVLKGSKASTRELDALLSAVGDQFATSATSSLCGVSPVGLLTTDSIQLTILGTISGHASLENDGLVHIDSCRATLPLSQYATTWSGGHFYKAGINHLDGTFRNGEGWWGNDRKPIKWFNCQF